MRLAGATTLASIVMLASAATADAEQRYASPGGAGAECLQAKPCSLQVAVSEAKSGAEVIVGPGTYQVEEPLHVEPGPTRLDIHGDETAAIPTLVSTKAVVVINPPRESRLAYLKLVNSGTGRYGVSCYSGSRIERVDATVTGQAAVAIYGTDDCAVRDSVARADGEGAVGLYASTNPAPEGTMTAVARNVTAVATGKGSSAVVSRYMGITPGASETLDARNLIAEGDEADLATSVLGSGAALIRVSNSNFDKVSSPAGSFVDLGGNQSAPPAFVDAAAGDYREAAGSPTIDAGVADQLGTLDLAGNPRALGSAPDIGAYEFVPPQTSAAAEIQSLSIAPRAFRAANIGSAVASRKKGGHAPVGAKVTYLLSAPTNVNFSVERKVVGRSVKGKCVKKSKANEGRKTCALLKPVKGSFNVTGAAGQNRFTFSGRIGSKPLKSGVYRLVGRAGGAAKQANFRIVR